MGTVFEAIHVRLNRHVALKMLKGEHLEDAVVAGRFVDEASITSGLRHPNIVEVLDAGSHEGTPFLVMELLEGELLSSRLAREHLELPVILGFAYQATRALEYAHQHGVIHRDLKPENLYVVADPRIPGQSLIKVLDFSIAKLRQGAAERAAEGELNDAGPISAPVFAPISLPPSSIGRSATRVGLVFGTPPYMAPEQCQGLKAIDARTDVYALGVILYEMLTGRVPFEAEDVVGILQGHISEPPADVRHFAPDVPEEVAAIVAKSLAKDPAERYQSMAEFGAALSSLTFLPDLGRSSIPVDTVKWDHLSSTTLVGIGAQTQSALPTAKESTPQRSRPKAAILGAILGALCIAGIAYVASGTAENAPGGIEQRQNAALQLTPAASAVVAPSDAPAVSPPMAPPAPVDVSSDPVVPEVKHTKPHSSKATSRPSRPALGAPASKEAAKEVVSSLSPATLPGEQPSAPQSGKLTFDSAPWANVYLNGKLLGPTPLIGVVLPAGKHTLELRSPETKRQTTYVVEIKANQNVSRYVGWESE
jgi:eukaryotic-like serine/threonine-protein kinase